MSQLESILELYLILDLLGLKLLLTIKTGLNFKPISNWLYQIESSDDHTPQNFSDWSSSHDARSYLLELVWNRIRTDEPISIPTYLYSPFGRVGFQWEIKQYLFNLSLYVLNEPLFNILEFPFF